ncbi:hypothetical protein FRB95_006352 [Tulasnella sp. JGI-2019a]|nr:hypothetical protein FRB95_006352 [Tulasnella sp. JGI-2019a]
MQSTSSIIPAALAFLIAWQTALVSIILVGLGLYTATKLARKFIFVPKYTIMNHLPNIGKEWNDGNLGFRAMSAVEDRGETNVEMPKSHEIRTSADGLHRAIPLWTRVVQYLASHGGQRDLSHFATALSITY